MTSTNIIESYEVKWMENVTRKSRSKDPLVPGIEAYITSHLLTANWCGDSTNSAICWSPVRQHPVVDLCEWDLHDRWSMTDWHRMAGMHCRSMYRWNLREYVIYCVNEVQIQHLFLYYLCWEYDLRMPTLYTMDVNKAGSHGISRETWNSRLNILHHQCDASFLAWTNRSRTWRRNMTVRKTCRPLR